MKKRIFKIIGIALLIILAAAGALLACLTLTEYRPEPFSDAETAGGRDIPLTKGQSLRILSWNTGYAGLDSSVDFFMDGGTMVNPTSQKNVEDNMSAIADFINQGDYDICLLQEVDRGCSRTGGIDELAVYTEKTGFGWTYAPNYRCSFVPYPLPPIGKVETGIVTMSDLLMSGTPQRISLPCPFQWPVRAVNLKRCLLVSRYPIEDSEQELVIVNLHLEAYDNGEGKIAQSKALLELLEEEYQKGNYVIAGGDFNQTFTNAGNIYPIKNSSVWAPGILDEAALPEGWHYIYDTKTPSCRLLNQPYDPASEETQYYIIDGFLVSPNVEVRSVETADLNFANSDHNPVRIEAVLSAASISE